MQHSKVPSRLSLKVLWGWGFLRKAQHCYTHIFELPLASSSFNHFILSHITFYLLLLPFTPIFFRLRKRHQTQSCTGSYAATSRCEEEGGCEIDMALEEEFQQHQQQQLHHRPHQRPHCISDPTAKEGANACSYNEGSADAYS
jgi:hypothetical protein